MTIRRERRERTLAKLAEPEFLEEVLDHVSEGGTLLEITRQYDIKYRMVHDWLHSTEDRVNAFKAALTARDACIEDKVIGGISIAAEADIRKLWKDGRMVKPDQLPDDVAPAISDVQETVDPEGKITRRYKMADKTRNFELLGRTRKMFVDRHEVEGKMSLEQLVAQSMKEAA